MQMMLKVDQVLFSSVITTTYYYYTKCKPVTHKKNLFPFNIF